MRVYWSCNCKRCRRASSARKGFHKDKAHRAFRRASKLAMLRGDEAVPMVSTGYKA